MRVLVAYSDTEQVEQLAEHIVGLGPDWQAELVASLSACEEALAKDEYEVVVWDLDMPDSEGLWGIEKLRDLAPHSYLIATTSAGDELLGAQALLQGADFYVARHEQWMEELIPIARRAQEIQQQRQQYPDIQQLAGRTDGDDDQRLSSLVTAVQSMSPTVELSGLAGQVLLALDYLLPYDVALVVVGLAGNGVEPVTASAGLDTETASELAQHLVNNRSLYQCEADKGPTIVPDWQAFYQQQGQQSIPEIVVREGLRSGGVLPLATGGELVGIVWFGLRTPWTWPKSMKQKLQIFAVGGALHIATATLHDRTKRGSTFTQELLKISTAIHTGSDLSQIMERIVHTAIDICQGSCAWIEVLDEERAQFEQTYTYWPDEAIANHIYMQVHDLEWSAVQKEEIVYSDLPGPDEKTIYNAIAFPLRSSSGVVGVLAVVRPAQGPPQGDRRNVLQLVAAQAAIAIHNARLWQLAEQRTRRMEAAAAQAWEEEARARTLFEAATAVTGSFELSEVLSKIAINAATTIGFERVRIYLADHDKGVLRGATEAESDRAIVDISDQTYRLRSGENPLVDAALSSAPYIIAYSGLEKEDEDSADDDRYEQLFMPLRAQGTLVGTIAADNPHSRQSISPQATRLLRSLAGMASVAIDRAQIRKTRELFMSAISHELRTPLASLQAYNELLLDEEAGPVNEEQRVYLDRVDQGCQRLRRVIDDLMSWSRLQVGEISIDKRPTDMCECVTQVVETLKPQAAQAQVQVEVHRPQQPVTLLTDAQRVEQIIMNLVGNAIKFNQAQGRIDLTVREEGDQVIVDVADTGPGISPPLQDRIFEAFNRGADDISRGVQGVGLGLTMASRIAGYLGGKITLDSKLGVGSTFSLHLPRNGLDK